MSGAFRAAWCALGAGLVAVACSTSVGLTPLSTGEGGAGGGAALPVTAVPCVLGDSSPCLPGDKCTVVDAATGESACGPAGTTPLCGACDDDADCPATTYCTAGRCGVICQEPADCASYQCEPVTGPDGEPIPGVGTCHCEAVLPGTGGGGGTGGSGSVDGCNPFTGEPCGPEEHCLPYDGEEWSCIEMAAPPLGYLAPCPVGFGGCDAGLLCVPVDPMDPETGVCTGWCYADAPGSEPLHPCSNPCEIVTEPGTGESLLYDGQPVGICSPF